MASQQLKILVTGGSGFIGSAVIRHIIETTNHFVLNVDKLTYASSEESLSSISSSKRYSFIQVDICDQEKIAGIFNQYNPDCVMHLAAESHVDRSIDSPKLFIETNIVGTFVLLEQARFYWRNLPQDKKAHFRFHHISTDEVYGDLPHPDDEPDGTDATSAHRPTAPLFQENSPYAPSSPYSASKASSDHLVRAWHRTYGLPTVITNCSNNYGPYHFPEKLIPLTILNAVEGKPLPVYGTGRQIRDWLFVEDHAKALLMVLTQGKVGETYNIGGDNELKNIEVVHTICDALQKLKPDSPYAIKQDNPLGFRGLIKFVEDRPGHDKRYAIDSTKIKKELGWQVTETFASGISKTVLWYLNNQDWCRHVAKDYERDRLGVAK